MNAATTANPATPLTVSEVAERLRCHRAHVYRVGFVNSIARICRQIQRSGGGARPPGSGRAIVARRLSRQFALPSDADAKRARDIWDLAIPFLRRMARRGEGLHLQPEL